ncbi:type II secretion system major pseudopilin GspG [Pelomonas sp. Root1237]|uniref:type II secretion system major pseudopilin GspG n=1 Tax=Pelomonas sp. Root1237 TaxID=1736434 RepID=UPI0006FB0DD1|nr:type II secretion system major pseudopilin GspG [Pelomonas sp. Root1237]KQV95043.1 type II secretion system protein GspG [Pelomonas sp. Root1237]
MTAIGRGGVTAGVFVRSRPRYVLGFTLLELLIVMVIIGLLMGIVGPRFIGQISRSEATTARAQIDALDKALQAFRLDLGRYPSSSEGLRALIEDASGDKRWRGPYLAKGLPVDPWGMPYRYHSPSAYAGRDYDLVSFGRDRAPGGVGDDGDVQL